MLKKLVLGCGLVVALATVGTYAAWRQLTRLPDWYAVATDLSSDADGRSATPQTAPDPSRSSRPVTVAGRDPDEIRRSSSGRVELDERQLNELLIRGLDEHRNGRRLKRAAKAVRASIHGDRLEVGVVTNLADMAAVAENGRESEIVRRIERFAPWLKGRDFYLGARGKPRVKNGNLFFDRDVELVIGGVGFNAADTAARFGVPQEELDAGAELPIAGLRLEGIEIHGDSVVLSLAE
ncbi:MAG: hypothetical protein V3T72_12520 [Thermoanaerobaculia bacterium]